MTHPESPLKVRFAPSPTGWLHIGNARTALYNWLFARHHGAAMILRIEDTDVVRSTADSESGILESLRWLGLDWDEGPEIGGPSGPYRQSERLDIYRSYADMLVTREAAYPCFCTPEQLEEDRQAALAKGKQPHYVGRCACLNPSEVAARMVSGPAAIRFRVPQDQEIVIDDLVRGRVTFPAGEFGDFVILRSNGLPSYNFAVVADDHGMAISHVIRGEDHLSNTPKQIFLYQALGFPLPRFAHLSMILGPDQARLSKRHGATSVAQFKELGYLPEALVNYLALLGWSPGDDREIMGIPELVSAFSLERVSRSASIFDQGKLAWMNGIYLRQAQEGRLAELARPFLEAAGLNAQAYPAEAPRFSEFMELVRGHAHVLSDLPVLLRPYLETLVTPNEEACACLREPGIAMLLRQLAERIEASPPPTREDFVSLLKALGKELGLAGKKIFMPVRAALTGEIHGPDLDRLYLLLGPVKAVSRLRDAATVDPE